MSSEGSPQQAAVLTGFLREKMIMAKGKICFGSLRQLSFLRATPLTHDAKVIQHSLPRSSGRWYWGVLAVQLYDFMNPFFHSQELSIRF